MTNPTKNRRYIEQNERNDYVLTVSDITDLSDDSSGVSDAEFQQIANINTETITNEDWAWLAGETKLHQKLFTGSVYYVDAGQANNDGSGLTPELAKKTITAAITAASAGDMIISKAGTYAEAVDLNKASLEFWPEIGTVLAPASGTPLTISAAYCRVVCPYGALRCNPIANGTGVVVSVTGTWAYVHNIRVPGGSTADLGFDIVGAGSVLTDCRCSGPLVAAFKIQGNMVKFDECCTGGEVADTSIGFWITNSCDKARLKECSSQGHATAGYQFDSGCTNISARACSSGGGDGHFIDNAENTFLDIIDRDSREQHEHTYPGPDGEGTAGSTVDVQSEINDETGADSTANYYGDVASLVPVATLTTDWFLHGVNVFATTAGDDQRFELYRVEYDFSATRNGGNNWDEGATVLTFDDASAFKVNDLVWIESPNYAKTDSAKGEIVKITGIAANTVTIARQTENSGRTGLHWNHTTQDGGNEVVYLCWRDENQYHTTGFDYSATGARAFTAIHFTKSRRMHGNDGLIVRMINGTDAANSQASLTIIYSD